MPNVSFVSQLGCRWKRKSQGPIFSASAPPHPQVSQISAYDLTELWSQLCLVPGGGSAQDACFEWRMPGWLSGKMRGEAGVLGTGRKPLYHKFDHHRTSGKSSISGGDIRPTAVGSVPGFTQGADLRVGIKPRFSFWIPQDGNQCFPFPSHLPELILSFLRSHSCYKTIYGSPLPTGLSHPNSSDFHLVLSPMRKPYLLRLGAFCLLFPLLGKPVPPFPPPQGACLQSLVHHSRWNQSLSGSSVEFT